MRNDNQIIGKRKRKFLPLSADRFRAEKIPKPRKGETRVIFLTALFFNLILAYQFKFVWELGEISAIQHTSKAFYILYTQGNPLASLNLIHPPIPVFLQLVPVPILLSFNAAAFSGPLLSSLFGAGTLLILNRILLLLRVHDHYRWILLLLTQLYPSFFFAAAIGSVEAIHLFVVLVVLWGVMLINRGQMAFLICSFGITLGFFVQYRIIGLLISVFLALSILKWNLHENWQKELEGWLLAFITPPLYAIGLWLLLNWLNQNDPFYFLKSLFDPIQAPSIARNVGLAHPYFLGWDNLIEASVLTTIKTWESSALFIIGSAVTGFFGFFFKRRRYIANLVVILSLPVTLCLLLFVGVLPPWDYLWASLIPLSIILACQPYQDLQPLAQNWLMVGIIILTLGSIWINFQALGNNASSPSEGRLQAILLGDQAREGSLRRSDPYWVFQHDAPIVAAALDRYSEEGKILVDGTVAAPALVKSKNLAQMVILKNLSYSNLLSDVSNEVEFVLLLSMDNALNNTTLAYPASQDERANAYWAFRVWQSDHTILDWEIYQIVRDSIE